MKKLIAKIASLLIAAVMTAGFFSPAVSAASNPTVTFPGKLKVSAVSIEYGGVIYSADPQNRINVDPSETVRIIFTCGSATMRNSVSNAVRYYGSESIRLTRSGFIVEDAHVAIGSDRIIVTAEVSKLGAMIGSANLALYFTGSGGLTEISERVVLYIRNKTTYAVTDLKGLAVRPGAPYTLSGRVTVNGAPVAEGTKVDVGISGDARSGAPTASVTTGADGRFTLSAQEGGGLINVVEAPERFIRIGIAGSNEVRSYREDFGAPCVYVLETRAGDANADGVVNVLDLNALKTLIAGRADGSAPAVSGADVNGDGAVNALDLNVVKKMLAG